MWKISENGKAAKILQKAFAGCLSVPQCRIMTELSLLRKYLCYKLWKCCTSELLFLCWYNIQELLWLPVDVRLFIVRKCPLFKLTNRSLTGLHGQLSVKKSCVFCAVLTLNSLRSSGSNYTRLQPSRDNQTYCNRSNLKNIQIHSFKSKILGKHGPILKLTWTVQLSVMVDHHGLCCSQ